MKKFILLSLSILLIGCSNQENLPVPRVETGLEKKVSELDMRVSKLEEPPVQKVVTGEEEDYMAADAFLQSEESCQVCIDYAADHQSARDEFKECKRHWYFSTHMATVCTFEMPWKAPSGRTISIICPGFNNKYCVGPMFIPHTIAPNK